MTLQGNAESTKILAVCKKEKEIMETSDSDTTNVTINLFAMVPQQQPQGLCCERLG